MPMLLPIFASDASSRLRDGIVGLSVAIALACGAGLATTFATAARAADATTPPPWSQLPLKAPPAWATPYFDWSGFYVGGHVGYSRGNARVNLADDDVTNFSHRFGSLIGGLQGGYNYVLPSRLLLGIEADASFPNFLAGDDLAWFRTTRDTDTAEKIDFMSTVRGRLGYAFDHWMVYATGGFAWSLGRFRRRPALSTTSTRLCTCTRAGRPARARSSPLPRTGSRGSNMSTPILATPMSCFRPARRQALRTTCT